jgi:WD40 repeat protein
MCFFASQGKSVITTSPNATAALVSKSGGEVGGVSTLGGHSAAVTSVDWHPTKPVCLTGSQDHSVLVTVFDA